MMSQLIDQSLYDQLIEQAEVNPRRRAHHNLHQSYDEPVQRVCIGLLCGTYVRPHAHRQAHQWELILGLQGETCLIIFDPAGTITQRFMLSERSHTQGIELPPGTWHTLYPVNKQSIILEIKQGPYNPDFAAVFADWAPEESEPESVLFLQWLHHAETGSSFC
ncbi:MAG: WbuC family cupin fold metalloprotein [Sedimenticola sp.]|nr:WbuC family cupin fold metalloprotein [Sedimenticola sp.]